MNEVDILTTPVMGRRVMGWTFDQWSAVAARVPKDRFAPTPEGALALRKYWLNHETSVNGTKNSVWALELFRVAQRKECDYGSWTFAAGSL